MSAMTSASSIDPSRFARRGLPAERPAGAFFSCPVATVSFLFTLHIS
jgi:hypothetical protein